MRDAGIVVTLGREAHVDPVSGTQFENWDTDEPSERGIEGIERMRLIRDDIATRVADVLADSKRGRCKSSGCTSAPGAVSVASQVMVSMAAETFAWNSGGIGM